MNAKLKQERIVGASQKLKNEFKYEGKNWRHVVGLGQKITLLGATSTSRVGTRLGDCLSQDHYIDHSTKLQSRNIHN